MSLKPITWRRSSSRLTATFTAVVAVLSCATFITAIGLGLSVAWATLLLLTNDYDSSPPFMVAVATATGLTWIWRMQLARRDAEHRVDEELIEAFRASEPGVAAARRRDDAAFREITKYLDEGGHADGLD
jgi:H+/Cl- antiporter ClcA